MSHLLNLRPAQKPVVIEKVIVKKPSFWVESLKMLVIIGIVSGIVYGISKAASVVSPVSHSQNFSATATVNSISSSTLSLVDIKSADPLSDSSYIYSTLVD